MLYTEDFSMHHYVGFSQIGSHLYSCTYVMWLQLAHPPLVLLMFSYCLAICDQRVVLESCTQV